MSKKSVEILDSLVATDVCAKWNIVIPEDVIEVLEKMDKVNINAIFDIFCEIDYVLKNISKNGRNDNASYDVMGKIIGYLNCMKSLKLISYKERWTMEEWLIDIYYDCDVKDGK